jgi:EAL domain-containing protein (putative c-di-GMP-specific phosphodiesterase class I)
VNLELNAGSPRCPRSIAIVRYTVALAHSLAADLVAEGVEDVDTLSALRQYRCNITQGNVHTPPLPADQLQTWLTSHGAANLEVSTGVG